MYAAKRALKPVAQFGAAAAYRQVSARPHSFTVASTHPAVDEGGSPSGRPKRQMRSCRAFDRAAARVSSSIRGHSAAPSHRGDDPSRACCVGGGAEGRSSFPPHAVGRRLTAVGTSVGGGPNPISRRRPSSLLFDSLRGFFSFIALVRSRDGGMGGGDETPDVLCFARARDAHDTHRASRRHPNAGR